MKQNPPLFFLFNGQQKPQDTFVKAPDHNLVIYEVVRLKDGVYLFLEDHLERLAQSAKLAGLERPAGNEILKSQLYKLAELNRRMLGNVRLDVVYKGTSMNVLIYFVPHHYPSPKAYIEGVDTITLQAKRENPNAKIIRGGFRQKTDQLIAGRKVWEVLLCNAKNEITEGSKSNVFVVHKNKVLTPPGEAVLKGITRGYVFRICHELNIPIREEPICLDMLPAVQALFITGTSPKILPVKRIDKQLVPVNNPVMRRLMQAYDSEIASYITDYKTIRDALGP